MFVQIIQVFPKVSRSYTDRMGASQVFNSIGMIIDCGHGTIYVEAVQEVAAEIEKLQLKPKDCGMVQLGVVARSYKTSQGEVRYSNEFTIKRFVMV